MKRLLSLAGLLVAIPSLAFAVPMQTEVPCESDADCAKGELCMLTSGGCPPCEPGTDCEPCDVGTGEMFCVPDPSGGGGWGWSECETDADCPSNYVCNEISVGCANGGGAPDCACPTCAEGEECEPCDCKVAADPMPCEEETAHVCEPAPCSTDADCGEGWECLPIEQCWGGGSVGCGCACPACEPGAECPPCECEDCPEPSDPPEYQCETVGSYCSVKPVECMDDSECPDGSYCAFWSDGGGSTGGGTGGGCACGCDCAEGEADCECPPCDCGDEPVSNGTSTDAGGPSSDGARDNAGARAEEPQPDEDQAFAPAVGMCVSTDYYGGGTGGGGIGAEYPQEGGDPKGEGGGGDNGATSGPGTSNDGNGAGVGGEGSGSGEGTGGTGSGEGTGGTGGDGTVEGTFSGSAGDSDTQTGCSAASGSANAGALALLVLMLAFALAPLRRERVR